MAPYRALDINVASAKDLKEVNLFSKMDVYAFVSLSGDESSKQSKVKTTIDRDGGSNPTWNFPVQFTIDEALARQNRLTVVFKIKSDRTLGDKDVGEVNVPVKELLNSPGDGKSMQFVNYQVRKPSGKPKGMLSFSYKFGNEIEQPRVTDQKASKADQHATAYPAAVAGTSSAPYAAHGAYPPPPPQGYSYPQQGVAAYGAYPPPQGHPAYAYPPPPPGQGGYGYGYPPPQQGYGYGGGYPPVVQAQAQAPKKNKLGMGLGAGLLGGAIGGLLIGDMVSDGASYDGGFDDGGGFDF